MVIWILGPKCKMWGVFVSFKIFENISKRAILEESVNTTSMSNRVLCAILGLERSF